METEYRRPLCKAEGCDNTVAILRRKSDGSIAFHKLCSHHRYLRYGPSKNRGKPHRLTYEERKKNKLRKDACEHCGWNEAKCDLHRIDPGGPYIEENAITLCPDCHRVETEKANLQDGFGGR